MTGSNGIGREYVSAAEAATILDVCVDTVYKLIDEKRLTYVNTGSVKKPNYRILLSSIADCGPAGKQGSPEVPRWV